MPKFGAVARSMSGCGSSTPGPNSAHGSPDAEVGTATSLSRRFAISGVPPIRSFAIFGMLGLVLAWLAVITLVPPVPFERRSAERWLRPLLAACVTVVVRRPRTVIVMTAIVTAGGALLIPWLPFEPNPLHYFPPDARLVQDSRILNKRLTGMLPSQIVVSGDNDPRSILTQTPGVRKVIDVSPFVVGTNRVYWCLADNDALTSLTAHFSDWQAWANKADVEIQWRGVAAQLAAASSLVRKAALLSLPAMALAAAVVVGWLTRSWRLALTSVWGNLLPIAGLLLVTAVARWPVEIPSLMTGAIAIGLAIDDTVHMANGIRRAWSPKRILVAYWRPCVGSTLVTAVCMLLFALAPFGPTAQFGIFIAVAAFTALLGDIVLLPAMWQLLRSG